MKFRVSADFSGASPLLDNFIHCCFLVFLLWRIEDLFSFWPSFLANHVDCIVVASWLKCNGGKLSVTVFWIFFRFILFSWIGKVVCGINLKAWLVGIDINLSPCSVMYESACWQQLFQLIIIVFFWFVNDKLII